MMMTDREKLVKLLQDGNNPVWGWFPNNAIMLSLANYLLANEVTFAKNATVESKWIPVSERLPEPFVPVLVQMPGEVPFPTVREGFISRDGIWYSALYHREPDEITHWMPLPEPPKGE